MRWLEKVLAVLGRPQGTTGRMRTTAAINYLADLGAEFGAPFAKRYPGFEGRRLHLKTAMAAIRAYERPLAERLISGLLAILCVIVYGITDPFGFEGRTPTAAFRLESYTPPRWPSGRGGKASLCGILRHHALAVTG